ncbi:hypothetical protein GRJ2_001733900 [Grus japonensis]|uniref:Uncharacterized protein n=1 Tax=Grus japonensis TaxID=30415 RepID=A0ABC9X4S0_GRUJA
MSMRKGFIGLRCCNLEANGAFSIEDADRGRRWRRGVLMNKKTPLLSCPQEAQDCAKPGATEQSLGLPSR